MDGNFLLETCPHPSRVRKPWTAADPGIHALGAPSLGRLLQLAGWIEETRCGPWKKQECSLNQKNQIWGNISLQHDEAASDFQGDTSPFQP